MPTRSIPPSPIRPPPRSPIRASFKFPVEQHLLVTTQKEVITWDQQGIKSVFQSGSRGILAAKEASDGSGLLAVADSQVVVLHDVRQALNRSYRLKATEGKVRLLEYSSDSQSIYFTTTLQNAVQIYSLKNSSLIDPLNELPSPPTALSLSCTSHLAITASENPTGIYVQNLVLKTGPQLLLPRASSSPIDVIAFHPERANIFLLAFRDGTLAAYDATRLPVARGIKHHRQTGEISNFKNLHVVIGRQESSVASEGGEGVVRRTVAITGAAFIKGYQTRAISVGRDGKARLVDFDLGGKILRTWHVKAPATCLSVLQSANLATPASNVSTPTGTPSKRKAGSRANTSSSISSTTPSEHIIAIGRQDGKVLLFNGLGLLLQEKIVDAESRPVLGVHWMSGAADFGSAASKEPSKPARNVPSKAARKATSKAASKASEESLNTKLAQQPGEEIEKARDEAISHQKLPHNSSKANDIPIVHSPTSPDVVWRPATPPADGTTIDMNTDELEADALTGTVNYVPLAGTVQRDLPQISTNYMDLFSPVKPEQSAVAPPNLSPKRARVRPRLRSSTFVDKSSGDFSTNLQASLSSAPDNFPGDKQEAVQSSASRQDILGTDDQKSQRAGSTAANTDAWETATDSSPPAKLGQSGAVRRRLLGAAAARSPKFTIKRTPKKTRRKSRPSGVFRGSSANVESNANPPSAQDPATAGTGIEVSIGLGMPILTAGIRRVQQTDGSGLESGRRQGNISMLAPYINPPTRTSEPCKTPTDSLAKQSPPAKRSPALQRVLDVDDDIWCTSVDATPATSSSRPTRPTRRDRKSNTRNSPSGSDYASPSMQSDGTFEDPLYRSSVFLPDINLPTMADAFPTRPRPHPLQNARPHPPRSPRSPKPLFAAASSPSLSDTIYPSSSASKPKKRPSPHRLSPGAARCEPLNMHEWFPRRSSQARTSTGTKPRRRDDDLDTPHRQYRRTTDSSPTSPMSHASPSPLGHPQSPESPSSRSASRLPPTTISHAPRSIASVLSSSSSLTGLTLPICGHAGCAEVREEMQRMRQEIELLKMEMREMREGAKLRRRSLGFGRGNSRGKGE